MDNKYFDTVISSMSSFISAQGFKEYNGVYKNDSKAFKVEYSEDKKLFILFVADVTDGNEGEFTDKSSWLFDEGHGVKDAQCVAEDFIDTLSKELGLTKPKATRSASVDLPQKAAAGSTVTVSALCSSLLAVYPQFKDSYKEHIETYGEFLCINFFSQTVTPQLKQQLVENNKKQLKKVMDVLCDSYVNGDRTVCNIIPEVIILKAVKDDEQLLNTALSYMDNCPYLATALKSLAKRLKSDKKLQKVVMD